MTAKQPIFYLEDRGGNAILYHLIVYNLGGLYYINNKTYNLREFGYEYLKLNDTRVVDKPSLYPDFPITPFNI